LFEQRGRNGVCRTIPEQCPEPGYYYHYKHDPNGPLNNYAGIANLAARGLPHAKHTCRHS